MSESWNMTIKEQTLIAAILREEIHNAALTYDEIGELLSENALRGRIRAAAQEIRARRSRAVSQPARVV